MGDTGSLFLGGAMAGAAFMINDMLVMAIACGVFIFETLSVVIQVTSFKLVNKRVFLMSPVHHHFEAKGWSENKIVFVFSLVSLGLCAVSWFGL